MKSLLKETLLTFITIPRSLSHIHLKTSKIEAKNVVELKQHLNMFNVWYEWVISLLVCVTVQVHWA